MKKVKRNAEWVEREYGQEKWPAVIEVIREMSDPLSSAFHRAVRSQVGPDPHELRDVIVNNHRMSLPVYAGSSAFIGWVANTVAAEADEADAIIELGSGWGRMLLATYLYGGPPDAIYVAAEFTQAGREAAEILAARDKQMHFKAVPFNYLSSLPWLTDMPLRRAVVFTSHSVEQVPRLPQSFIPSILSLAEELRVLHFEPVGWQIRGCHSEYAEIHDYNRNLVALLRGAESRGEIRITQTIVDALGTNPDNPTSLIAWEPTQ